MIDIEGGCFCGDIRFRASIDETRVGLCHCRDCQIFSGSAFRTAASAAPEDFVFTRGEPRIYTKTSDRGTKRHLAFCGTCGTHICALPDSDLQRVTIRLSSCDGFEQLTPAAEIFCQSRVAWLEPVAGARQFDTMP